MYWGGLKAHTVRERLKTAADAAPGGGMLPELVLEDAPGCEGTGGLILMGPGHRGVPPRHHLRNQSYGMSEFRRFCGGGGRVLSHFYATVGYRNKMTDNSARVCVCVCTCSCTVPVAFLRRATACE